MGRPDRLTESDSVYAAYEAYAIKDRQLRSLTPSQESLTRTNSIILDHANGPKDKYSRALADGAILMQHRFARQNPDLVPSTWAEEAKKYNERRMSLRAVARNRLREHEESKLVAPGIFSVMEVIGGQEIRINAPQPDEAAIQNVVASFVEGNDTLAGHRHLVGFLQERAVKESRDRKETRRGDPFHRFAHRRGARHHLLYATVAIMERHPLSDEQKEQLDDVVSEQTNGMVRLLTDPDNKGHRHYSKQYNDASKNGVWDDLHPDIIHIAKNDPQTVGVA